MDYAQEPILAQGADVALIKKLTRWVQLCVGLLSLLVLLSLRHGPSALAALALHRSGHLPCSSDLLTSTAGMTMLSEPWSAEGVGVLIVYASKTGHTESLAMAIASGAASVVGEGGLRLRSTANASFDDVLWADTVLMGSPTYNAAVAPELQAFVDSWPFNARADLRGKLGGAFVTCGGITAGHELVLQSIHASLLIFGFLVVPGPSWQTALGAYAVNEDSPDLVAGPAHWASLGRAYGEEVANLTKKLRT